MLLSLKINRFLIRTSNNNFTDKMKVTADILFRANYLPQLQDYLHFMHEASDSVKSLDLSEVHSFQETLQDSHHGERGGLSLPTVPQALQEGVHWLPADKSTSPSLSLLAVKGQILKDV